MKAILYIHGKGGNHLEAEQYKKNCEGYDIIGVDYEEYLPWIVRDDILEVYNDMAKKYDHISIIANSIGAYFTMYTLQGYPIERALFISPILNMERLILDMMSWANVTEDELRDRGEIETDFGETLSWEYLNFVRDNPIEWSVLTEILYAGNDNLTSRQTVDEFVDNHDARVIVMKDGEHWFHTDEQVAFLNNWMRNAIR